MPAKVNGNMFDQGHLGTRAEWLQLLDDASCKRTSSFANRFVKSVFTQRKTLAMALAICRSCWAGQQAAFLVISHFEEYYVF